VRRSAARNAALVFVLASGVVAGCASSGSPLSSNVSPTASRSTPRSVPSVRLRPLTKQEQAACEKLARTKLITVLCPSRLPRPETTSPATPIGVHTFPVCREWEKKLRCPLYDFAVLYGAPDESPGRGARNTPADFLHFEVVGGGDVLRVLGVHRSSNRHPLQRLISTRTIAGHPGYLYFGLPYNQGGGQYGSHYTFVWRQGSWSYAASLHSWTPHTATLKVLAAIIAHLGPVHPHA
jgi:hypothetical protein